MAEGLVHSEGRLQTEDGTTLDRLIVPRDIQVDGFVNTGVITAPSNAWGVSWPTAVRQANQRLVRVVVFSDSLGMGQGSTHGINNGWVGRLAARTQARFGDGGSGYISTGYKDNFQGGSLVTTTGSWTDVDTLGGLGRMVIKPTAPGNGATMTFPVRGTAIKLFLRTDPTFGTFHWQLDGGSFNAVALNSASSVLAVPISASAGTHTVTVRATTGDGGVYGCAGYNSTGVVFDNVSYGGTFFTQLAMDTAGTAPADLYQDTLAYRSLQALGTTDLVICCLGANDVILDADDTIYEPNIWNAAAALQYAAVSWGVTVATPPEVVIIGEHVGKVDVLAGFSQYERDWIQIHATMRQAAMSMGAVFVDVWAAGKRSWDYWDSLGYFFVNGGVHDDVHLSDAGYLAMTDLIWPVLARTP